MSDLIIPIIKNLAMIQTEDLVAWIISCSTNINEVELFYAPLDSLGNIIYLRTLEQWVINYYISFLGGWKDVGSN